MSFQDSAIDELSGEQIQMFSSLRRSSDHTERPDARQRQWTCDRMTRFKDKNACQLKHFYL